MEPRCKLARWHGTYVAGTIAAIGGNGNGVVGISRNGELKLHIVRVFGNDGLWAWGSTVIAAVQECVDNGANVVNMSLGGPYHSQAASDASDFWTFIITISKTHYRMDFVLLQWVDIFLVYCMQLDDWFLFHMTKRLLFAILIPTHNSIQDEMSCTVNTHFIQEERTATKFNFNSKSTPLESCFRQTTE